MEDYDNSKCSNRYESFSHNLYNRRPAVPDRGNSYQGGGYGGDNNKQGEYYLSIFIVYLITLSTQFWFT